jgi:hypothetical protein
MLNALLQNLKYFIGTEFFAAACRRVGRLGNRAKIGVGRNIHFRKGGRQPDLTNKVGQRLDSGKRGFFVACLRLYSPDIFGKADETGNIVFVNTG